MGGVRAPLLCGWGCPARMRVLGIALVLACLLMVAPVEAGPGSGQDCDVEEEYVTGASLGTFDPSDPTSVVQPGAPRPVDCKY